MIWNIVEVLRLGYSIVALWAEINSVFLHSRKLLQIYKMKTSSKLYITNTILNFATFILFRFGSCVYLAHGLYKDHPRLSLPFCIFVGAMIFVMSGINPILFWRLFKSDVLRHRTRANQQDTHFGSPEISKQPHQIHSNGYTKRKHH